MDPRIDKQRLIQVLETAVSRVEAEIDKGNAAKAIAWAELRRLMHVRTD